MACAPRNAFRSQRPGRLFRIAEISIYNGAIDSSYRLIQALISSISFFLFFSFFSFFYSRSFAEPLFEKWNIFDPRGKSLATSFILKLPDKVSLILFSVHSTVFSRRCWLVSSGQVRDFSLFVTRTILSEFCEFFFFFFFFLISLDRVRIYYFLKQRRKTRRNISDGGSRILSDAWSDSASILLNLRCEFFQRF